MNTFRNNNDIIMMVWETNPSKRNINNKIKCYISPSKEIKEGDLIWGNESEYKVINVLGRRKSAHSQYDYVYLETKYFKR